MGVKKFYKPGGLEQARKDFLKLQPTDVRKGEVYFREININITITNTASREASKEDITKTCLFKYSQNCTTKQ